MKIVRIKTYGIILSALSFLLISACSTHYKLNLVKARSDAIKEDKTILAKRARIKIESPLSLKEAVNIGLNNNLNLWVDKILAEAHQEKILAEKLKMLPNLNVEADITRRSKYDISRYKYVNPATMEPYGDIKRHENGDLKDLTVSDDKQILSANLKLSWNLLDCGLTYIRSKQKALDASIKEMETKRQAQKLTAKIVSAYWKAAISEKNLNRVAALEIMLNQYKKAATKAINQKRASLIALKEAENKLIELAIKSIKIQALFEASKIELANLMGLPISVNFNLADEKVENFITNIPKPTDLSIDKMENVALQNRPELFISDMELNINKQEAKALLVRMLPGIRFDAMQIYNSSDYLYYNSWNTLGANIAWNLFGLPSKYYAHKAQKKNIAAATIKRIETTAAIMTQMRLASHDFAIKNRIFKDFDSFFKNHSDITKIGAEYHKTGLLSDADMTEKTIEKFNAKLKRDKALSQLIDSYTSLMITMGFDYSQWFNNFQVSLIIIPNKKTNKAAEPAPEDIKKALIDFDTSTAHIDKEYRAQLNNIIKELKNNPSYLLEINPDNLYITNKKFRLKASDNNKILKEKISAIKQYFITKGIDPKRLVLPYKNLKKIVSFNKQYASRKLK
ncbi:MAG: TolC family protein [Deltaproteobacteria bacterium]|nr:TolC family protein [Deltaproteobacteria bacterium]